MQLVRNNLRQPNALGAGRSFFLFTENNPLGLPTKDRLTIDHHLHYRLIGLNSTVNPAAGGG